MNQVFYPTELHKREIELIKDYNGLPDKDYTTVCVAESYLQTEWQFIALERILVNSNKCKHDSIGCIDYNIRTSL